MKPFLLISTRPEEEALVSEYQAYLKASGLSREELELAEFDLIGLPPIDLNRYQGVFVAGSPYGNATVEGRTSKTQHWVAEELRVFLRQMLSSEVPCLCTGTAMTILADLLGGPITDEHVELGEIAEVTVTHEGRQDPLFAGVPEAFVAYVSHSESCESLPEGATRLAWSLNCPIQALRFGAHTYAVQFNPELNAEAINSQITAYAEAGDFGAGDADVLVTIGRHARSEHGAAQILRNFVGMSRA